MNTGFRDRAFGIAAAFAVTCCTALASLPCAQAQNQTDQRLAIDLDRATLLSLPEHTDTLLVLPVHANAKPVSLEHHNMK